MTRPISPHLSVYKPQISSVLSILHRATGAALFIGTFFVFAWIYSASMGPETYATFYNFATSDFGTLLLFGWSWAFFYHLCTGIRHLFWDAGYGFEIATMNKTGWLAVGASCFLTLLTWLFVFI